MRALFERKRVKVKMKESVKVFVDDRSSQAQGVAVGFAVEPGDCEITRR